MLPYPVAWDGQGWEGSGRAGKLLSNLVHDQSWFSQLEGEIFLYNFSNKVKAFKDVLGSLMRPMFLSLNNGPSVITIE